MSPISFKKISPSDTASIHLIAEWYLNEWNIPTEKTITKISGFPKEGMPFQILMELDGVPVATGGLYDHVSLLDREPRFKAYKSWLALIFTTHEHRNKGHGGLLCEKIQTLSKDMGLKEIFLFTHTAESLYLKLGWQPMERLQFTERNIVVMKKEL